MPTAYWFCPEHDIALAYGSANFTPPKQAAILAHCGAPLMWWLGDENDYVVLPADMNNSQRDELNVWRNSLTRRYGKGPTLVESLKGLDIDAVMPWGWSEYAINQLQRKGASAPVLAQAIANADRIRNISHRRSSIEITHRIIESIDFRGMPLPDIPVEATDLSSVEKLLASGFHVSHNALYAKAPWSSSGRGVVASEGILPDSFLRRCSDIIRTQQSVLIEPSYNKVVDFAMLFKADAPCHTVQSGSDTSGKVSFYGFSLFHTSRGTNYSGNLIASDADIINIICKYIPRSVLMDVQMALCRILQNLINGAYQGFLGVDMMIAQCKTGFMLVPCVELNLRCTMGVVAHALYNKLGEDYTRMCITHAKLLNVLPERVQFLAPKNPYFHFLAQ